MFIDMSGKKIGKWTFLHKADKPINTGEQGVWWMCICECGHKQPLNGSRVRSGRCKNSCKACIGFIDKRNIKGKINGAYKTWRALRSRCLVSSDSNYHNYGGRGVKICDSWKNDFKSFYKDMGDRPRGFSIDRIDVDGDYSPDNCRWVDNRIQSRNKRNSVLTDEQIPCIIKAYNLGLMQEDISLLTGASRSHISNTIINNKQAS